MINQYNTLIIHDNNHAYLADFQFSWVEIYCNEQDVCYEELWISYQHAFY